jgi:membrane protease YdiL (CAAX protease family)
MNEPSLNALQRCPHCQGTVSATDSFCGHCGKELKVTVAETLEDVFSTLQPTLLYYFITLILLATYKFTNTFPPGLEGMIFVTLVDVFIVIAFWANYYENLKPLFSFSGLSFKLIVLTILGAITGSVVVSIVAKFINLSIHDDVFYDTYLFEDTSSPFLFATLLIAVQPAIFEEVTFRGFLFDNLKRVSNSKSAVYISGFVFGIMHLQIISLLWLVPIGLTFGYLRDKYNTLWYGVIGHFVYNFSITFFEFKGWF